MNHNSGNSLHQPGYLLNGRYRIMYLLGEGGFGKTYVAQDEQDNNRQCVVKQLHLQLPNPNILEQARHRFRQEADALQRLGNHPQIPQYINFFEENHDFYLVQEFIDGQDLEQEIIPSQPWRETDVISLLKDVLEVLSFIHQQKIIHRDIKPSNLIRRHEDGKIILVDFGAIKEITTLSLDRQGRFSTQPVGTPDYMAPEQTQRRATFSSDIYALGITAIQALIGSCPPKHELTEKSTWRKRAKVSRKLAKILNKMVHQELRERYQSASDVLADLNRQPRGINWRLWGGLATATILLIVLGGILSFVRSIFLYKEATALVNKEEYEPAIKLYNQAIELNPNFTEALADRGYALIQSNKYQDGLNSCEAAIKISPNDSKSWNCKGVAQERLGNNNEAITAYELAIKFDSSLPDPWNNKGEVLLKEQKSQQALTAFNEAIRLKPDYRLAWTNKGKALHQLGDYKEAVNAFKKAIKIDNNYYAWIGLGNALRQLNPRDLEALKAYERAIEIDQNIFDGWFAKGAFLESSNQPQEALIAYKKAAEIRPDYEPLKEIIQRLK